MFGVAGSLLLAAGLVTAGQASAQPQREVLGTNGAPVPELAWGPCAEGQAKGYECAEVEVPLSYRDPDGKTITLALGKLPAKDQENKLGTIFFNPGGPGGSGRFAPELTPELHERFDIVGFDPRGIAASTPLRCFDDPAQGELLAGEFPATPEQTHQRITDTAKGTELCEQNAGELIGHMSTANVARDMDLLRQALGEEQTSYYGISYGSHLGTVYANLFPDKVGAVAIDAVLDPVEWTTGERPGDRFTPFSYRLGSHDGAQRSLETFLDACQADERCAFREPGRDLGEKYDAILETLREGPLEIAPPDKPEPFEVTYQMAVSSTMGALYDAANSSSLAEFLQALDDASDPGLSTRSAPVAELPPSAPTPGYQDGATYMGPEQGAGVFCADTDNPGNPWAWPVHARKADREAPGFGSQWTWLSLPCASWPASDPDRYAGPWDKQTANPVLVVGNSLGDPATPYDDAVSTSKRLGDARLLSLESFGHGARGNSECIDSALDAYFIDGALPEEGTVCQPDRAPFDPVS
ncbi:alpha/beta fold hydrolase [Prauserella sp. ASG 168]|uniref:Alpha/beta fold hydrolase n=1 Tax=Prauserella cavernicola TaxID=2800127 RepID=A0A934V677_9PSEU|nr:alpha/beta fold hydrolase [Prauserella cavernicola]